MLASVRKRLREAQKEALPLEKAVTRLLDTTEPLMTTETVPLLSATGRVAARDVFSPIDQPPFRRSPLDGYAFPARSTQGASKHKPACLRIVGEVFAGACYQEGVRVGEAVKIMTGAPIPEGCDAVARIEDVKERNGEVSLFTEFRENENVVPKGEDFHKGTCLIHRGTKINTGHIALLAGAGFWGVEVYSMPHIFLATTGDELQSPGHTLSAGKIYNSNLYLLASLLRAMGFVPFVYGNLGDEAREAAVSLREGKGCDILLTTGGVSVGERDIMHDTLSLLGATKLFWRVAMKPGAPLLAYRWEQSLGLALSGNPFAAFATFQTVVRPVLAHLAHREDLQLRQVTGYLMDAFHKESAGRRFLRARYEVNGEVHLFSNHASGALSGLPETNALVDIPAGTGTLAIGDTVQVLLL